MEPARFEKSPAGAEPCQSRALPEGSCALPDQVEPCRSGALPERSPAGAEPCRITIEWSPDVVEPGSEPGSEIYQSRRTLVSKEFFSNLKKNLRKKVKLLQKNTVLLF